MVARERAVSRGRGMLERSKKMPYFSFFGKDIFSVPREGRRLRSFLPARNMYTGR